tara:strand:- start:709 stop:864 length:156 start_codon:yes stop_codon:yes gene_type:complete
MKLLSKLIGHLCFVSPVGNFLFKCFLSFLYDVFWFFGFVRGWLRNFFGGNE